MEGPMHGVNCQSFSIGSSLSRLMSIAMMDLGLVRKLKACPAGFWGFDESSWLERVSTGIPCKVISNRVCLDVCMVQLGRAWRRRQGKG